jgi:hypothetical protein
LLDILYIELLFHVVYYNNNSQSDYDSYLLSSVDSCLPASHVDSKSDSSPDIAKQYIDSMNAFKERRFEELVPGEVISNTRKGYACHGQRVIDNYRAAWGYLLCCSYKTLSLDLICETHMLLTNGLMD